MVGGRKSRSKPFGLRLGIGCLDQQAGCWLGIDREAEACWIQQPGPARFSLLIWGLEPWVNLSRLI